jgi:hypothetical protein
MKKYSLLAIAIMCLLSAACKKDKKAVVVNGISSTKSISAWNTTNVNTGFKPLATKDTLFITGQNGEENIVIAIKQKGAGTYLPTEFKAYFYTTVGLDVVLSKYQLYSDPANSVIITSYDETTHLLIGTFNLLFKSTYRYDSSFPDEIKFTNGKINTALSDVYMDPFK